MPLYTAGQKIRGSEINSLPQTYRVTSNQICNNSTVMRDAVGLSFQGEAHVSYLVEVILCYKTLHTALMKLYWATPAGCTGWWAGQSVVGTSRIGDFDSSSFLNAFASTFGLAGDPSFAMVCTPVAMVALDVALGVVKLQFAQVNAVANDSIIYAGSCLRVTRLG